MKVVVPVPDIEKHYKGTYSGDQADQHQELQNCLLWRTSTDPFKTEIFGETRYQYSKELFSLVGSPCHNFISFSTYMIFQGLNVTKQLFLMAWTQEFSQS